MQEVFNDVGLNGEVEFLHSVAAFFRIAFTKSRTYNAYNVPRLIQAIKRFIAVYSGCLLYSDLRQSVLVSFLNLYYVGGGFRY